MYYNGPVYVLHWWLYSGFKIIESSEESVAAIDALELTLVHANQACEVVPSAPIWCYAQQGSS